MATHGVDLDVQIAHSDTQTVARVVEEMQAALRKITSEAADAKALWQGKASSSFQAAIDDWNTEGTKLKTSLDNLAQALQSGFNGYENEDIDEAVGYQTMSRVLPI